jgi:hypothetical protein
MKRRALKGRQIDAIALLYTSNLPDDLSTALSGRSVLGAYLGLKPQAEFLCPFGMAPDPSRTTDLVSAETSFALLPETSP